MHHRAASLPAPAPPTRVARGSRASSTSRTCRHATPTSPLTYVDSESCPNGKVGASMRGRGLASSRLEVGIVRGACDRHHRQEVGEPFDHADRRLTSRRDQRTRTVPATGSTSIVAPSGMSSMARGAPITPGRPSSRAMTAAWLSGPPSAVTSAPAKPTTML